MHESGVSAQPFIIDSHDTTYKSQLDNFSELFETHGALLLRNAVSDDREFVELSNKFSCDFLTYSFSGRDMVSSHDKLQTVDHSTGSIPPHSELCDLPIQPRMAWLYCCTPAAHDGKTTLYDGLTLVDKMPPALRSELQDKQLRYRRTIALERALEIYNVASPDELAKLIADKGWNEHVRIQGNFVVHNYVVPLLTPHRHSGKLVLANQLLHNTDWPGWLATLARPFAYRPKYASLIKLVSDLRKTYLLRRTRPKPGHGVTLNPVYADGRLVPARVVRALHDLAMQNEMAADWQANDILVFDNKRMMHGRQAFTDTNRRILTRFGELR